MVGVGDSVIFVDAHGVERPALLTAVHGVTPEIAKNYPEYYKDFDFEAQKPSVNLIIISDDENKRDPYGRQIERHSSVVHQVNQFAHGNYWK